MDKTVYIVGTAHIYQGPAPKFQHPPKTQLHEFRDFLSQTVQQNKIRSVGEEMNLETLRKYPKHDALAADESVPFLVAKDLHICFRFCDPETPARDALGISKYQTPADLQKKEQYWLQNLKSFTLFPCLFVCGAKHVKSFQSLLEESGFTPSIVCSDWAPNTGASSDFNAL
jgi:hypothetical protein